MTRHSPRPVAGRDIDDATRATAMALLVRIKGNFHEATAVIVAWSRKGEGFFGTLKQARERSQQWKRRTLRAQRAFRAGRN